MTENEKVISVLKHMKNLVTVRTFEEEALEKAIQALEEVQQYRAIGTVEEFNALKEKNVAKKIVSRGQGHEADCYCPNCNAFLGNDQDWCFNQTNHCSECGQALET